MHVRHGIRDSLVTCRCRRLDTQGKVVNSSSRNGTQKPERTVQCRSSDANDGTEIYYKDWGTGDPIVFSHGWPLNADAWDAQMLFFGQQGYRVIAHDRRSHGRSEPDVGPERLRHVGR